MVFGKIISGSAAALLLTAGMAAAQGTKPTDPQIAHIAYTAGQLDIQAAQLALFRARKTWRAPAWAHEMSESRFKHV
jgi:predicted outer membrane protein